MPLGVALERWAPACWAWLHQGGISPRVIQLLSQLLPCVNCRIHLQQYLTVFPVTVPTDVWLWMLHNDVNRRTGARLLSKPEAEARHCHVDRRLVLTEFLFAVALTLDADRRPDFVLFCSSVLPTIGMLDAPTMDTTSHLTLIHSLHEVLRPCLYPTVAHVIIDFLPPTLYLHYAVVPPEDMPPVTVPCSGAIGRFALATMIKEEWIPTELPSQIYIRVLGRLQRNGLQSRVHAICPVYTARDLDLRTKRVPVQCPDNWTTPEHMLAGLDHMFFTHGRAHAPTMLLYILTGLVVAYICLVCLRHVRRGVVERRV